MASDQSEGWWRPDAVLPALLVISPYFLNKLIYIYFPSYPVFLVTDYIGRIFSLGLLYLLLRNATTSLPIRFRLAVPSAKELSTALVGTIILIGSNVACLTIIKYLNAHSWRFTAFPSPTNSILQYFDSTVGMVFVGFSEETIFRFYLMNLLLLRGESSTMTIILSTLIFAAVHWSYGAGSVFFSTLAGLVLSMIFMATRNLVVPVVAHAAYDATYFAGGVAVLWRVYNSAW